MNRDKNKKQIAERPPTRPFFARFLEQQTLDEIVGGAPAKTMKYPSDGDENDI